MAPHYDNPWDIFHSFYGALNPNGPPRQPGAGVDHTNAPPPFPFGGPHPPPPPPGAFPFGPNDFPDEADWAGRGGRGRRNRSPHYHDYPQAYSDNVNTGNAQTNTAAREAENEKGNHDASPDTVQEGEEFPDPAEVTPSESDGEDHGHEGVPPPFYSSEDPSGRRGRRGGPHGRGGWGHGHAHSHSHGGRGRCGGRRGGWRRGFGGPFGGGPGAHGPSAHGPGAHGPGGPHPPPPHPPFDFPGMMRGFMDHPFFQNLRDQAERYYRPGDRSAPQQQSDETNDNDTFTPPIDIFNTPTAFILHTALPGAKKEDIGVTWNPQSRTLRIAGVVHRPGDEAFLQTLTTVRERRVGVFEKEVKLPPAGVAEEDQDVEVDGSGITAKMEEGVLIVTVPKVEKEWMEVRKVDIE